MLSRLEAYQFRYNIRVRPWTGPSYTLNLALIFTVLSKFYESKGLQTYELHNFIESKAVTGSEWLECLTDYDQNLNVLVRLIRYASALCFTNIDLSSIYLADMQPSRIDQSGGTICLAETATTW